MRKCKHCGREIDRFETGGAFGKRWGLIGAKPGGPNPYHCDQNVYGAYHSHEPEPLISGDTLVPFSSEILEEAKHTADAAPTLAPFGAGVRTKPRRRFSLFDLFLRYV